MTDEERKAQIEAAAKACIKEGMIIHPSGQASFRKGVGLGFIAGATWADANPIKPQEEEARKIKAVLRVDGREIECKPVDASDLCRTIGHPLEITVIVSEEQFEELKAFLDFTEQAAVKSLVEAAETVIEMNLQTARDKYGDETKAETWACVRVLREALRAFKGDK